MTDLIARLEAATEGSRELDCLIGEWQLAQVSDNERLERALVAAQAIQENKPVPHMPHYTTSIDAALTLVPADFAWIAEDTKGEGCGPGRLGIGAGVWNCPEEPPIYRAETVPLALCIAALRARTPEETA